MTSSVFDGGTGALNTQHIPTFAPADGRAQWTKGLLVVALVLALVGHVSSVLHLQLLSRIAVGTFSREEFSASRSRQALIAILQLLAYYGTAVAFLMWFYRVHENLPALCADGLDYTPRWAVGGFFVPFLNLVRPLQVMREVWHGSDPSALPNTSTADSQPSRIEHSTPALIGWWWALFLLSNFVGNLALVHVGERHTVRRLQSLTNLQAISDLLTVPSALLAFRLVSRITRMQTERAKAIRETGAIPVSAGPFVTLKLR